MSEPHTTRRLQFAFGLTVAATLMLVSQHWGMMLSNSDDPWLIRASWQDIEAFASGQKRFWMLIINYLTTLPYQWGGWTLGSLTKMVVNSATLLAFFLFLRQLVHSAYALLVVLIWLALMDVSNGYYSAFHGYLLMFNLPMCLLFLSLAWYVKKTDAGASAVSLLGPFILFGLALLAYEPMLFFTAAFPAISLLRAFEQNHSSPPIQFTTHSLTQFWQALWRWCKLHVFLFVVVIAFIFCYFGYRWWLGAGPSGLMDPGSDWGAVFKTMYRFSVHGFRPEFKSPTEYTFGIQSASSLWLGVAYATAIGFAAWWVIPQTDQTPTESRLRSPWAILILAGMVFSLNSLHALNEGYRQWAADNPYYVGNYLSSFGLAMLVTHAIQALVGGDKSRDERVLLILTVAFLMNSAASNMMKWGQLADRNRQDAQLWHLAIADLKQEQTKHPTQDWMICAQHAPEKVSGDDRFWSYQLSKELGARVSYHSKQFSALPCDQVIDFDRYR